MAKIEVRIPAEQGEERIDYSIDSGEIVDWHKKVGDPVAEGELLLAFDISKAVVEIPSPVSGILVEILVPAGNRISTKRWDDDPRFLKRPVAIIGTAETKKQPEVEEKPVEEKPVEKPVEKIVEKVERPVEVIREKIAKNMEIAAGKPTASSDFQCDFNELLLFKKEFGKSFEGIFSVKFHVTFPVAAAIIETLKKEEFSKFNDIWEWREVKQGEGSFPIGYLHRNNQINLGISFAGKKGLVVLVIHKAEELSFQELTRELDNLSKKARDGSYTLRDLSGETIIFNNIGGLRMTAPDDLKGKKFKILHKRGNSLLTPGASLELNLGAIDENGEAMMQVFFDHRVFDGKDATDFAYAVYAEIFRVLEELKKHLNKNDPA